MEIQFSAECVNFFGAPAAGGAGDEQRLPVFRYVFLLCTPILSIIQTMKNTPCLFGRGWGDLLFQAN